ncbi:MAG: SurA N-terminal domain-containing protein [Candidatus Woykebacteria bacterium]
MARAKKTEVKKVGSATKAQGSTTARITPSKRKPFNLQELSKNLKERFQQHQVLYSVLATLLIIIILLGGTFFWKKDLFLAGSVNGKFITSVEFYNRLIKASGTDAFDSIIQETLIKQEAKKAGHAATQEEIDAEISKIEKRVGGREELEKLLAGSNMNVDGLREQLVTQVLVEKILEKDIQVSDAEVDKYIKENKDSAKGLSKEEVKEQLRSQKLNEKFPSWYEEIKKNASIQKYF